ncbi:LemA family protein, partial [Candidatus Peregrinibacteria bacterium]|nr:LemA family protein [Candidatus Peregrinibacteria bacterium]
MVIGALILAVILIAGFVIILYNGLVRLRNKVNEAWADIDTQLKRRYDLIPNLVETVKGYATHEKDTLEKITQARNMAMQANTVQEKEQAENMLTSALKTVFALAENYPDLKANQNFMNLQNTLKEIEEHIQLSRRYYNSTVREFNTKIEIFPNNLIAGALGFNKRDFFQAGEGEKENVKVSFKEEASAPTPPTPPAAPKQE